MLRTKQKNIYILNIIVDNICKMHVQIIRDAKIHIRQVVNIIILTVFQ